MKRVLLLGLFLFAIAISNSFSQSNHTISINGVNDGWTSNETFTNCSAADNAYFTWDADYIYFAISDADAVIEQATFMYFDIDPSTGNGTSNAYAWGDFITTPFNCDFVVVVKNNVGFDYIEIRKFNGTNWEQVAYNNSTSLTLSSQVVVEFAVINGSNYREFRVKRSVIENPSSIKFCSFTEQLTGNWRYFAWPSNGWTDKNRGSGQSIPNYYGFILDNQISPISLPYYNADIKSFDGGSSGTETAWGTAANWTGDALPGSSTLAIIPSGKDVVISSSTDADVYNLKNLGTLTIKSDASGTGSLIHNSSNVPATVERYITGSTDLDAEKYHLVCRPFTENYTSAAWMDSYLFEHNEAATTEATAWTAIGASTTYPLTASKGYLLYYPEAAKTYSHTGTLKSDNTTVSTVYTSGALYAGYNLLANMYSSALDFSNATYWTGCESKFWIWNSASGNYGSYSRTEGGTLDVTKDIPIGQGFFITVTSAGTLTIDKAARVHSNQAYLKNSVLEQNKLRIKADANIYFDEILMSFNNDASTEYDSEFDVKKMIGQEEAPQLSSIATDGTQLSINSLPFTDGDVLVPLNFSLTNAAEVTFNATGIESFNPNATLYFEDTELGQVINLREQPVYTINYGGGAAENRFWLRMGSLTVSQQENLKINGTVFASHGKITIDIPSMQNKNVTINVFNSLGQLVSLNKAVMTGIYQVSSPLQPGVYIVKVGCNELNFTQKVIIK